MTEHRLILHSSRQAEGIRQIGDEYLHFVSSHHLAGKGIGFVDIHILASAYLDSNFLWTLDKKLNAIAIKMKLSK